ncbi:MAG: site-specific integrase [Bacteroidales bacterium]|nr:site-specific integrase [Bacteroidales bacterium]
MQTKEITNGNLMQVISQLRDEVMSMKELLLKNKRTERSHREMNSEMSFISFMKSVVIQLKQLGRVRTSETYTATLNSFMAFRKEQDIPIDGITSDLMLLYEAYLKGRGVCKNTISFYMRNLRSVYNRAVAKGLIPQGNPFQHVYTGVDKTVKRAISIKTIKTLKEIDLSMNPKLDFARDMFMFSFYTRGMSFVDMAYLKKSSLKNGILTYRRRKTGQELNIKWEKCMAEIIAKYPKNETDFLLPIIKEQGGERRQYDNALHLVNYHLKELSTMLKLQRPLSMYVARHSWASAAKAKNVPLSVISEGMGHDSETTTQIYLASLETSVVDKANKMILGLL